MYDLDGSLLGGTAGATVVTQNSRVPTSNPSCSYVPAWSAYQCSQTLRLLILQGLASSVGQVGDVIRLTPVYTTSEVSPTLNITSFSIGPIDDNCALETYSNFIPFLALANAETNWVSQGSMIPNALISVHSHPIPSERFLFTIFYTTPMLVKRLCQWSGCHSTHLPLARHHRPCGDVRIQPSVPSPLHGPGWRLADHSVQPS